MQAKLGTSEKGRFLFVISKNISEDFEAIVKHIRDLCNNREITKKSMVLMKKDEMIADDKCVSEVE